MRVMKHNAIFLFLVLFLTTPVMLLAAQGTGSSPKIQASPGMMKTKGVLVERLADGFTLRDEQGSEMTVAVTELTVIKEKKRNFFRKAINYSPQHLLLGLKVQVEGHGDISGDLVAHEIKFTQDDLRVAQIISSRVSPMERRLQEAHLRVDRGEGRQDRLEQRTEALSDHIMELNEAFGIARDETREAQSTADRALSRVDLTDQRVSALDEYREAQLLIIQFEFDSADLSATAKAQLDGLASQTMDSKGFLIEVRGFASSDGDDVYNIRLSQRRAELVMRYLVENLQIPLRRIITPHGYGERSPVAENSSRQGRQQNRRVEVRLLVNQGLESADLDAVPDLRSATTF